MLFIGSGASATPLVSGLRRDVQATVAATARQGVARLSATPGPAFDLVVIVCARDLDRRKVPSGVALLSAVRRRWPGVPAVAVVVAGTSVLLLEPCGSTRGTYLDRVKAASVSDVGRPPSSRRERRLASRPRQGDGRLARVIQLINERYTEHLAVADLARLAQLTPRYFRRQLRLALGVSLRDYVRDLRLARARRLIATTNASLTDVALEAGFYDLPHFDKTFRKRYGVSPYEFRRRKRLAGAGQAPCPARRTERLGRGERPRRARAAGRRRLRTGAEY